MNLLKKNFTNCKECIKKKEKIQQIGVKSTKKRKNVLKFYKIGKVFVQIHNKSCLDRWKKCKDRAMTGRKRRYTL